MSPPPGTPRHPNAAPATAKHLLHPTILLRPARGLIIQSTAPAPAAPLPRRTAPRISISDEDEDDAPPQRSPTPSRSPDVAAAKAAENGHRAKSPDLMVIDDESPEPEDRAAELEPARGPETESGPEQGMELGPVQEPEAESEAEVEQERKPERARA
ncbi:hypothetical protein AMAG_19904 [Allomyces macrogynus ATCC 38327]|uniref:Uncharacterized protein n=1 Tax=Allomyces macrogynus (strain ATCC 38327) TaxID=578462 RepID=A0A0L0T3N8_ALLM3|nr:hypothetical protein AMAG_19904 [Allomyces macrogynus ATCC 38327]|eukprot:KNE69310.1 hypothetical protein AMAG_19904 [Allomyces macrogynus ATCC 38327]